MLLLLRWKEGGSQGLPEGAPDQGVVPEEGHLGPAAQVLEPVDAAGAADRLDPR